MEAGFLHFGKAPFCFLNVGIEICLVALCIMAGEICNPSVRCFLEFKCL